MKRLQSIFINQCDVGLIYRKQLSLASARKETSLIMLGAVLAYKHRAGYSLASKQTVTEDRNSIRDFNSALLLLGSYLPYYAEYFVYFSNQCDGAQKVRPSSKMLYLTYAATWKDRMPLCVHLKILFGRKLVWST